MKLLGYVWQQPLTYHRGRELEDARGVGPHSSLELPSQAPCPRVRGAGTCLLEGLAEGHELRLEGA